MKVYQLVAVGHLKVNGVRVRSGECGRCVIDMEEKDEQTGQ